MGGYRDIIVVLQLDYLVFWTIKENPRPALEIDTVHRVSRYDMRSYRRKVLDNIALGQLNFRRGDR